MTRIIRPGLTSPLRPVIRAFYTATHETGPDAGPATCLQALRAALDTAELNVGTGPPPLDLVVSECIGVMVLPLPALFEATAIRRQVRARLAEVPELEVALLMAFTPRPRLARINAPRQLEQREVQP